MVIGQRIVKKTSRWQNARIQGRTFGGGKDQDFEFEDFIVDPADRDLPFGKGGGPKDRILQFRGRSRTAFENNR